MGITTTTTIIAIGLLASAGLGAAALLAIDGSASCRTAGAPPASGVGCGSPAHPGLCSGDQVAPATDETLGGVLLHLTPLGGSSAVRICARDENGAKAYDEGFLHLRERQDIFVPLAAGLHDLEILVDGDRLGIRVGAIDFASCAEDVVAMDLAVEQRMLGRIIATLDGIACAARPEEPRSNEPQQARSPLGVLLPKGPIGREGALAGVIVATTGGFAALGIPIAARSHRFHWLLLGLFTRIAKDDALEHAVRAEIHGAVRADPGIGPEELRRRMDLSHGQLAHHLRVLSHAGLLTHVRIGRLMHFFPPGEMTPDEMRRIALLRAPAARHVLETLERHGAADVSAVAQRSGWSVSYTSRLTARMRRAGILEEQRDGRRVILRARQAQGLRAMARGALPAGTPAATTPP